MAFQPVPDTAEVAVIFQLTVAVRGSMTFHFDRVGGYSQAQLLSLAETMDGWAEDFARPSISNQISYVITEARGLANENDFFASAAGGAGIGGVVSQVLPSNVAFAVKRVSGLTGRSARGRVYWPGICEGDVDGNTLAIGRASVIQNALDQVITLATGIGWRHVIVSRFNNKVPRPTGIVFPVTDYQYTDQRVDSMRSRL